MCPLPWWNGQPEAPEVDSVVIFRISFVCMSMDDTTDNCQSIKLTGRCALTLCSMQTILDLSSQLSLRQQGPATRKEPGSALLFRLFVFSVASFLPQPP